jgi:hypothetical protein
LNSVTRSAQFRGNLSQLKMSTYGPLLESTNIERRDLLKLTTASVLHYMFFGTKSAANAENMKPDAASSYLAVPISIVVAIGGGNSAVNNCILIRLFCIVDNTAMIVSDFTFRAIFVGA